MYRSIDSCLPRLGTALLLLLLGAGLVAPEVHANQTLRYQVADGADDAEEGDDGPGVIDLASSDLELTEDHAGRPQLVGVRFRGIDIPRGTPIQSAYIQFATDEDDKNSDPFSVAIYAEATDDAAPYAEVDFNISARARTSASVPWGGIDPWTLEHEAGPPQRTPDLTALVQEIVDRDGWQAGNAMAFVIEGSGTRTAESYEGSIEDVEVADLAPQLVIVVPSTETYRVGASDDDAEEGDDGPGSMDIDSSDLEITEDHPGTPQTLGIRLQNVNIPQGAEILSAHLQFAVDEGDKNADPFDVTVWGEAADGPGPYVATAFNISSRTKTSASVSWKDIPLWTTDEENQPGGENQRTPDLSAIVQEIVDRDGWKEGNAMAFILQGVGQRTAESFDGDSALAPALTVTFIGENATPSSYRVRLSWGSGDDPATEMNVIWDQVSGSGAQVHYDLYDSAEGCPQDLAAYAHVQAPTRIVTYRGMNNHHAKLSGLTPDTAYRFVISDGDGVGQCMWFLTAPAVPKALTYISGGDTKSSGDALRVGRWTNQMVAKLRPLFVFFTGDFNSGDGTDDASWQQWLTDWSEGTRSSDGRMYPIIAVHGNHEDGDFEVLYQLFGSGNTDASQPAEYAYYSLSVGGGLLHVINLNSQLWLNGKVDAHNLQLDWLSADLAAHEADTFKVAGYHKPIRPHTLTKAENDHELAWADLFDQYGLTIAYESDTHNHKFTFPLRRSDEPGNDMGFARDDANGVLYAGEGSWGATPRANNDDKSWTLDSDSMNQFKWARVTPAEGDSPARIELRTVVTARYVDGELVNYVDGVGEVSDAEPYTPPAGITLHSAPFYGEVITLPFQALSGEPPTAPTGLGGTATSYTDITITWTNTEDPANVSNISVERKVGAEGAWGAVAGLDADAASFSQSELDDGTDYVYRVRANNVFGSSDWSNEVLVSTPVDDRSRAELSQGVGGYAGTTTIAIAKNSPDQSFTGEELSFDQGTSDYGAPDAPAQGLIRFEGLFGPGGVPDGASITGATLRFWTTSSSTGPVGLHQMLTPWDNTSSWNGFVDGLQTDGVEAAVTPDDSKDNIQGSAYLTYDVTASVTAWAGGAPNYGWLVENLSTDGWDIATELYTGTDFESRIPRLTVFYTVDTAGPARIGGAPAFAAPGTALTANAELPNGDGAGYAWGLSGPCTASGPLDTAQLGFAIDANAPVAWPSTPCSLTATVTRAGGSVETLGFDIVVLPSEPELSIQEAYIAYYGRPADPIGLHYWGVLLYLAQGNLDAVMAQFGTSAEYTNRLGGLSDQALINNLYQNMFGRDADALGSQWYIDQRLNPYRQSWTAAHGGNATGATEYALSRIALDILRGAQNEDLATLDHKREVARYFTEQVVRWGLSYREAEIPAAVAVLQGVSDDVATVASAKAGVDALIPDL